MLTALLTAAIISPQIAAAAPGDGFEYLHYVPWPVPMVDMLLHDEGVAISAEGSGTWATIAYMEAVAIVADVPAPSESPLMQCVRAAQIACGAAGVKSVTVTGDTCTFTCYPPSVAPKPRPSRPEAHPPGQLGGSA